MPTISSRSELAWKQYDKTGPGSGGQFPVKCRHCAHTFSTGTTRAIAHLLGGGNGVRKCTKVPKEVLEQLQAATAIGMRFAMSATAYPYCIIRFLL